MHLRVILTMGVSPNDAALGFLREFANENILRGWEETACCKSRLQRVKVGNGSRTSATFGPRSGRSNDLVHNFQCFREAGDRPAWRDVMMVQRGLGSCVQTTTDAEKLRTLSAILIIQRLYKEENATSKARQPSRSWKSSREGWAKTTGLL